MQYKEINFNIKEISESGEFSGYGAVFDNVDSYGDKIIKGAFNSNISKAVKKPALLWQHQGHEVIGVITDLKEDDYGLLMNAKLALKTQKGAETYELLKMGALDGLSIGYQTVKENYDKEKSILELHEVKLWEISVVTFPANEEARINNVKQVLKNGGMPTERELEGFLKEIGFSRTQSKTLIAKGYKAIQRDVESQNPEIKTALKEITNLFINN